MIADFGIKKRLSQSVQSRQRAFFVDPYQAARARNIRRQNRCQSPLYVLSAQDAPPGLGEIERSYSTIVGRCPAMPTSESGQSRRFDPLPATSGLPRTTDIIRPARLVRNVPMPEVPHARETVPYGSNRGHAVRAFIGYI
jgi:hypothetical protein